MLIEAESRLSQMLESSGSEAALCLMPFLMVSGNQTRQQMMAGMGSKMPRRLMSVLAREIVMEC